MQYNATTIFWRHSLETLQEASTEIITEPGATVDENNGSFWRFLLDLVETLVLWVALFLVINAVTVRVLVEGFSMRPTLDNGQYVLVNKMAFRYSLPEYGDIIVFHFPVDPDQDFIKRVIGLPGDEIQIGDGKVIVNGYSLTEPYIAASPTYAGQWTVPEGQSSRSNGSVTLKLQTQAIARKIDNITDELDDVPAQAYNFFREQTPIRTGNARRRTSFRGNKINAKYPYAQRLNQGWSRQAPDGMTEPTVQFIRNRVRRIIGGR